MKLQQLSMKNFRQFRDATIEFSKDPDKNITVIHGQNGSGKTTILNAFQWVLFDRLKSIKRPERLATQGEMVTANVGDTVTVEVELIFEHDGQRHEARRSKTLQKQEVNDFEGMEVDSSFTVEYITPDGNVEAAPNPESYVRQIIPSDLADLFFFDGEYISDLSGVDNQGEIQEAIRQMMGLTIMERAKTHLEWVEGEFRDELRGYASEELQELVDRRDAKEEEQESLERKLTDKERKRDRLQSEIQRIDTLLNQVGETRKLQERREELEEKEGRIEDDIDECNEDLESEISSRGFLPYTLPAIKDTASDLDELRQEGVIPSQLDNAFVDELLAEEECICNRPLKPGSDAATAVEKYKSDVAADGVDKASIQLIDKLDRIRSERDGFFEAVEAAMEQRRELEDELDSVRGELDDISTKIEELGGGVDELDTSDLSLDEIDLDTVEKVGDLEAARSAKADIVENDLKEDIILLNDKIQTLEEEIGELEEEIDDAEDEQREADLARKRMQAAKAVRHELDQYYQQFQQSIRKRANEQVDKTFSEVATADYEAIITDNFELSIRDQEHGTPIEVDKSRGERQVASLSFIASLVQIAREQYESDTDTEYFKGGIFPIVMDSPFGALDNEHRESVSRAIPLLAEQIIVFVTDAQWEGPVQREMGPNVGAHYKLEYDKTGGVQGTPVTQLREQSRADIEANA